LESQETTRMDLIEQARERFRQHLVSRGILDDAVMVHTRVLPAEEAVGARPGFSDLALLRGKEVLIEALFRGARGHAFTDAPGDWRGTLREALDLRLDSSHNRALLLAIMNAVLRESGLISATIHCRNEDIARCGEEMAQMLRQEFGPVRVGLVGYQPGLLGGLARHFGADHVRVTDLMQSNVGRVVEGVEVWDGASRGDELVANSDVLLVTGSTAANGTLDALLAAASAHGVPLITFGVTGAAIAHLCGLRRLCLRAG
jgi:hypothetical protein